jgi:hypothetical protein
MEDLDLSLYQQEVDELARRLGRTWRKLLFKDVSESDAYKEWGGGDEFLQILGMYMIIEKGLDVDNDESGMDMAMNELMASSF